MSKIRTKRVCGYEFEIIGSRSEGYEISFSNTCIGYADTLKEANEVIEQVVGNGIGDKELKDFGIIE